MIMQPKDLPTSGAPNRAMKLMSASAEPANLYGAAAKATGGGLAFVTCRPR